MGTMWGLDAERMRHLGSEFGDTASRVETVLSALGRDLDSVPWQGRDADAFRQTWTAESAPKLKDVIGHLRDAATMAAREADAQERASRADR